MANKQYSSRTIMVITILVSLALIAIIWPLSMIGKDGGTAPVGGDEAELRIQPVARVEMQKAEVKSDGAPRDGVTVYNSICMACHATGAAGAPKAGDKEAWAPRIATGMEALLNSALNGKGVMPPRGGGADLTDAEVAAAVEYLVGLSK